MLPAFPTGKCNHRDRCNQSPHSFSDQSKQNLSRTSKSSTEGGEKGEKGCYLETISIVGTSVALQQVIIKVSILPSGRNRKVGYLASKGDMMQVKQLRPNLSCLTNPIASSQMLKHVPRTFSTSSPAWVYRILSHANTFVKLCPICFSDFYLYDG